MLGTILIIVIFWIALTAAAVLVKEFGASWVLTWLAERDVWWSPVRQRSSPGHITMMTRGKDPGGDFAMILPADIPYWDYHEEDQRFYEEGTREYRQKFPNDPPEPEGWDGYLADLGLVWVGFFRRYYKRHRHWEAWDIKPGSQKDYGVVKKETSLDEEHIFYFATTMAVDLETIPTSDNYPAQMKVVFNALMVHPRRAEFLAGKWEIQAVAAVRARAREYIARKTVAELKIQRDSDDPDDYGDFVDHILKVNLKQRGETGTVALETDYGIRIKGPYYVDFDLESGDKEMTDAMKRQMIAEEDVKTARIRAKEATELGRAKANRRKEEAAGIEAEWKARMSVPEGADLSWAEAVRKSKPRFISLGLGRNGQGGVMLGVSEEDIEAP